MTMDDDSGMGGASAGIGAPYADVIFDFCDVLVDWRPRLPLEGLYPPEAIDAFFDKSDAHGFKHYDELSDLGWPPDRILADYARFHDPAAVGMFRTYFERQEASLHAMIPGMETLLRDLDARGVRLWGLTNFTVEYVGAAVRRFPALRLLRGIVVSSAERIAKPDPGIYRRAVARFGVEPGAAAFVDDKARNAEAASAAVPGLTGIRFTGAAALRPRLGLD